LSDLAPGPAPAVLIRGVVLLVDAGLVDAGLEDVLEAMVLVVILAVVVEAVVDVEVLGIAVVVDISATFSSRLASSRGSSNKSLSSLFFSGITVEVEGLTRVVSDSGVVLADAFVEVATVLGISVVEGAMVLEPLALEEELEASVVVEGEKMLLSFEDCKTSFDSTILRSSDFLESPSFFSARSASSS
jgi:hypothetical protein